MKWYHSIIVTAGLALGCYGISNEEFQEYKKTQDGIIAVQSATISRLTSEMNTLTERLGEAVTPSETMVEYFNDKLKRQQEQTESTLRGYGAETEKVLNQVVKVKEDASDGLARLQNAERESAETTKLVQQHSERLDRQRDRWAEIRRQLRQDAELQDTERRRTENSNAYVDLLTQKLYEAWHNHDLTPDEKILAAREYQSVIDEHYRRLKDDRAQGRPVVDYAQGIASVDSSVPTGDVALIDSGIPTGDVAPVDSQTQAQQGDLFLQNNNAGDGQ